MQQSPIISQPSSWMWNHLCYFALHSRRLSKSEPRLQYPPIIDARLNRIVIISLLYALNLVEKVKFKQWWEMQAGLSSVQKLHQFVEEMLLPNARHLGQNNLCDADYSTLANGIPIAVINRTAANFARLKASASKIPRWPNSRNKRSRSWVAK